MTKWNGHGTDYWDINDATCWHSRYSRSDHTTRGLVLFNLECRLVGMPDENEKRLARSTGVVPNPSAKDEKAGRHVLVCLN